MSIMKPERKKPVKAWGTDENLIGEIIKTWRVVEGYQQRDLAADIGITASSLCRLENGKQLDMYSTVKLIEWLFRRRT